MDQFDEDCIHVDSPTADSSLLSACEHLDRFIIKPVGCLDEQCNARVLSEQECVAQTPVRLEIPIHKSNQIR